MVGLDSILLGAVNSRLYYILNYMNFRNNQVFWTNAMVGLDSILLGAVNSRLLDTQAPHVLEL